MSITNDGLAPQRRFLPWLRWTMLFLSVLFLVYFFAHQLFREIFFVAIAILAVWVIATYRPINQNIEAEYDGRKFVFLITSNLIGSIKLACISGDFSNVTSLGKVTYSSSRLNFSTTIDEKEYSFVFFNPSGRRYFILLPFESNSGLKIISSAFRF